MRKITAADKEAAKQVFSQSICQNKHLGWYDLWEIPENSGSIFRDDENGIDVLLGFQYVSQSLTWLHSFYCDRYPDNYDLHRALRACGLKHSVSVYTISSHDWYSKLLERNHFRKCDEIIQFEAENIRTPIKGSGHSIRLPGIPDIEKILTECESSFPPIWRMGREEFMTAWKNVNYKMAVCEENTVRGYIMADLSEDNNCHIVRLAASRGHQNEGIASALVRQMIHDFERNGITSFSVNTNANNPAAVSFYRSLNLNQTGRTYPVWFRYI